MVEVQLKSNFKSEWLEVKLQVGVVGSQTSSRSGWKFSWSQSAVEVQLKSN